MCFFKSLHNIGFILLEYNITNISNNKSIYSFMFGANLLTSSYIERTCVSNNFLRGTHYVISLRIVHVDEWVKRRCEPIWGFIRFNRTLFFYNPLTLLFNLKRISMFIVELSLQYGNVVFINTAQYNLPFHYMMRWYARGSSQSTIGTVWQCGSLSNMYSRFVLVRRCLALPYKCYFYYTSHWRCTFAKILLLIHILRNYFFHFEYYGRVRKEVNKLRKIFKMFYYYRFVDGWSHLDAIVLLEPVYRRSYRMIREVNNAGIPAIGSCSMSNTALWYDYWMPVDYFSPSSNIFVTSFVANACMVGLKLRVYLCFLKNATYSEFC